MQKGFLLFLLLFFSVNGFAQNPKKTQAKIDSIAEVIKSTQADTTRLNSLIELGNVYQSFNPDSALYFHGKALELATTLKDELGKAEATRLTAVDHQYKHDRVKANELQHEALRIAEAELAKTTDKRKVNRAKKIQAGCISSIGVLYKGAGDYEKAFECFNRALKINTEITNVKGQINNYGNLALAYADLGNKDKAVENYDLGIKLSLQINSLINLSTLYGNKGLLCFSSGDFPAALEYYEKARKIDKELENKNGVARHLSNMGLVYKNQGDFPKALEYYFRALKIGEETGEKKSQGSALGSIGIVYAQQGEHKKAESYYLKALAIYKEIGSKPGMSTQLGHIGIVNMLEGDSALEKNNAEAAKKFYATALEYYAQAMAIDKELNNMYGYASNLGNVGMVYKQMGDFTNAAKNEEEALAIFVKMGVKESEAVSRGNLGLLYTKMKKYPKAEKLIRESIVLATELGDKNQLKFGHQYLYELYKQTGRPVPALEHYQLFIAYRDSVFSEENTRASIQQEIKFGYEKKAAADSVRTAEEKKVINAQLKQEQTQRYALYGGLSLVALFAAFMVNRFRITRKQKRIIEEQKREVEEQKQVVEEKQKEILDSIHYAKRIQTALIPSEKYIERNLKELRSKKI